MSSETEESIPRQLALDMADSITITGAGTAISGIIVSLGLNFNQAIYDIGGTMYSAGVGVGITGFALRTLVKHSFRASHREPFGELPESVQTENAGLLQNQV